VAAFTHLRHALVPTGRLAFVCWRAFADNEWVRYPMSAVSDMLPPSAPPGPEAPGPFAFGNADRVRHILTQAGFADVQLAPFDCPLVYGEATSRDDAIDAALELALQVGPISRALAEQAPDVRARAAEAVRAALAAREANNAVVMGGACWIVTARHSSR